MFHPSKSKKKIMVYSALAKAYRHLSDVSPDNTTPLTSEGLTKIIEGPNGYLKRFVSGKTGDSPAVYRSALEAVTAAAMEIGEFTNEVPILTPGFAKGHFNSIRLPTAFPISFPTRDPAELAYIVINYLLTQYEDLIKSCKRSFLGFEWYTQKECRKIDAIYEQAFTDIYSSVITTVGNIAVTDVTYISAVAHYVNLQLETEYTFPIISFAPLG